MERENLRRNLFAIISLYPKGLAASQLCKNYKKRYGVELDIRQWGCCSVVQFCAMFPQIFILAHGGAVGSSEDQMLYSSFHLAHGGAVLSSENQRLYSSCHLDCKVNKKHACTLGSEEKIQKQKLPSNAKVGKYVEVVIAEVVSPEKFWIQFRGENMNGALMWLMEEIKYFYGDSFQGYAVRDEDILSVGMVCANLHSDGYWYRAEVLSFRNLTTVNVFFIDYGKVFKVKKNSLAYLPRRFGELPGQAFEARLHGICPAGEQRHYSKEATELFLKLTNLFDKNTEYLGLFAMVYELGERLSLSLVDTSTNKLPQGININHKLVDEGLAVPDAPITNQVNDTEERNTRLASIISLKAKLAISKSTPKTAAPVDRFYKAGTTFPESSNMTAAASTDISNLSLASSPSSPDASNLASATPTDISNLPLATPSDITIKSTAGLLDSSNLAAVAWTTSGSRYLQSIIPQMKMEELNALQVILFFFK